MRLERADRLIDQRDTVGEEEDALRPVAAHQQVDQRDDRAGLAGARRHDQQRLALVVLLEGLADPADRARLVVPLDDRAVDLRAGQATCGCDAAGSSAPVRLFV